MVLLLLNINKTFLFYFHDTFVSIYPILFIYTREGDGVQFIVTDFVDFYSQDYFVANECELRTFLGVFCYFTINRKRGIYELSGIYRCRFRWHSGIYG